MNGDPVTFVVFTARDARLAEHVPVVDDTIQHFVRESLDESRRRQAASGVGLDAGVPTSVSFETRGSTVALAPSNNQPVRDGKRTDSPLPVRFRGECALAPRF